MKIKRHIPNACSSPGGEDAITIDFNSLDELLSIVFVKRFKMCVFHPEEENVHFKCYSLSKYAMNLPNEDVYLLMAEFYVTNKWKEGWWVIGYISKNEHEKLDLPEWTPEICRGEKT